MTTTKTNMNIYIKQIPPLAILLSCNALQFYGVVVPCLISWGLSSLKPFRYAQATISACAVNALCPCTLIILPLFLARVLSVRARPAAHGSSPSPWQQCRRWPGAGSSRHGLPKQKKKRKRRRENTRSCVCMPWRICLPCMACQGIPQTTASMSNPKQNTFRALLLESSPSVSSCQTSMTVRRPLSLCGFSLICNAMNGLLMLLLVLFKRTSLTI